MCPSTHGSLPNEHSSTEEDLEMNKTKILAALVAMAPLAFIPVASAADATCENANFPQEVLDVFGSVRFSCIEVVERNGKPHAMLRAEVVRVAAPNITLKFERNDGSLSNPVTLTPEHDYVLTVDDGREVSLREVTASSTLRLYVPVEAPIG